MKIVIKIVIVLAVGIIIFVLIRPVPDTSYINDDLLQKPILEVSPINQVKEYSNPVIIDENVETSEMVDGLLEENIDSANIVTDDENIEIQNEEIDTTGNN